MFPYSYIHEPLENQILVIKLYIKIDTVSLIE